MAGAFILDQFNLWKAERRFSSHLAFGLCVAVGLLLCSCATPYKPLDHGYGYSDRHATNDVYEVTFLGNGSTSSERAFDFAMLRAAEIALNRHAKSFTVLDVVNLSFARTYLSAPQVYRTTAAGLTPIGQDRPPVTGLLDWTERDYLAMEQAQERTYYRPGVKLKVKFLPDPPGTYYPYDPVKVSDELRRKYRIKAGKG